MLWFLQESPFDLIFSSRPPSQSPVRIVRLHAQHRLPLHHRSYGQSRWNDASPTRPGETRVRIVLNLLGPDLHLHHESPVFPHQSNVPPRDLILDEALIRRFPHRRWPQSRLMASSLLSRGSSRYSTSH